MPAGDKESQGDRDKRKGQRKGKTEVDRDRHHMTDWEKDREKETRWETERGTERETDGEKETDRQTDILTYIHQIDSILSHSSHGKSNVSIGCYPI